MGVVPCDPPYRLSGALGLSAYPTAEKHGGTPTPNPSPQGGGEAASIGASADRPTIVP